MPLQSGTFCHVIGLPPLASFFSASNSSVALLYLRPSSSIFAFSAAGASALTSFCGALGACASANDAPSTDATSNTAAERTVDLHTVMGTPLFGFIRKTPPQGAAARTHCRPIGLRCNPSAAGEYPVPALPRRPARATRCWLPSRSETTLYLNISLYHRKGSPLDSCYGRRSPLSW